MPSLGLGAAPALGCAASHGRAIGYLDIVVLHLLGVPGKIRINSILESRFRYS